MIRLKDIAERAGVSVMTVSKVLRDAPDISPATKARIRLLAQQMGYVPDSVAQGLRTRSTRLLGVVIPSCSHPVFASILMGLEERAHELGYDILVGQTRNLPEREEAVVRRLLSRRVEGLFIAPVYRLGPTAPIYAEITRRRVPTVIMGYRAPFCNEFANVESDDMLGSAALTQHLIREGHRQIAYFAGPAASIWAQERMEGYRRAHREASLEIQDHLIFSAGTSVEDGEKAALQMLNEAPKATAIQAVNDFVAIGAANVFLSQGMRLPHDFSVVGFDNISSSEYFRVPLTTAGFPRARFAQECMELLSRLLRNEGPEPRRIPIELIVRSSTAKPPEIPVVPSAQNAP